MPCNECSAPTSITNVYNVSVAASQFKLDLLTVSAGLTVTCSELPAAGGFFLLFLEGVPQVYGTDFTVDFTTGIITLIGATAGQKAYAVYIFA